MHKIWEYNRSETVSNNHSIESFDRSNLFSGKNVHEEVELFKKTLLRFFHNFIPKWKSDPFWMNDLMKTIIKGFF